MRSAARWASPSSSPSPPAPSAATGRPRSPASPAASATRSWSPASSPPSPPSSPCSCCPRRRASCRSCASPRASLSIRTTMPASHQTAAGARPRRRADAERSIARILDAAVDALGDNQEASMAEIARRAGVVRATIYVHFPTRETLLEAVTERALAETAAAINAAEPERGAPADALARVVAATWRTLGRYHALVAINTATRTTEELRHRHGSVLGALLPLIERGQADGVFRTDVPAA